MKSKVLLIKSAALFFFHVQTISHCAGSSCSCSFLCVLFIQAQKDGIKWFLHLLHNDKLCVSVGRFFSLAICVRTPHKLRSFPSQLQDIKHKHKVVICPHRPWSPQRHVNNTHTQIGWMMLSVQRQNTERDLSEQSQKHSSAFYITLSAACVCVCMLCL